MNLRCLEWMLSDGLEKIENCAKDEKEEGG